MLSLKILVVDDHEPFRRFVLSMLAQGPEYQVVGQAVDGAEAIRQAQERVAVCPRKPGLLTTPPMRGTLVS